MHNEPMFVEALKAPIDINIKTSTRFGGYSCSPFDSLNMGYFTGDDITSVIKNYYLYENVSNTYNIVTLNQVHGNEVLERNEDFTEYHLRLDAQRPAHYFDRFGIRDDRSGKPT